MICYFINNFGTCFFVELLTKKWTWLEGSTHSYLLRWTVLNMSGSLTLLCEVCCIVLWTQPYSCIRYRRTNILSVLTSHPNLGVQQVLDISVEICSVWLWNCAIFFFLLWFDRIFKVSNITSIDVSFALREFWVHKEHTTEMC